MSNNHLTDVAALAKSVDADRRTAHQLASDHQESECLQAAWSNLESAHTLLYRYLRLQQESGRPDRDVAR